MIVTDRFIASLTINGVFRTLHGLAFMTDIFVGRTDELLAGSALGLMGPTNLIPTRRTGINMGVTERVVTIVAVVGMGRTSVPKA